MLSVTRIFVLAAGVGIVAAVVPATARDGQGANGGQAPSGQTQASQDPRKGTPDNPPPGRGRGGPGQDVQPWWKDAAMAKEVGLTPMQISKFNHIYEQRQRAIQSKVDEYNRQRAVLDRLMAERTVKPDEVEQQARRLSYPHLEIDISRFRMLYEILRVMSPEQIAKMNAMFERERGRGRGSNGSGNGNPPRR